jgi:CDP-glucose 4,6-dehydratase
MQGSFWRDKRVLVTGHTGFKGSWLCMWLHAAGASVAGYALQPPTEPSLYRLARVDELVASTIADLRDMQRLERLVASFAPEIVLHLAAQSVVLTSYEEPIDTFATNVLGTAHLLEAIRRAGRPCIVVNVTTDKCYANRNWVWGYRETDTLGGLDPYSSSKACAEFVANSFRHAYFAPEAFAQHGVAVANARAGNVVGGGDWTPHQLIPAAVAAYAAGEPVVLRHPDGVRPWQHVLDCLDGYLTLAEVLATDPLRGSGDWNFGPPGDDAHSVAYVVETLARHWGVIRPWVSSQGVTPHEERELRLDSSKAAKLLGWRCKLPIGEALELVAEWYLGVDAGQDARQLCRTQIARFANAPRSA